MKFTRNLSQSNNFDIVITSMLDINFLLILFFILTAQFQSDTHATLDLPKERGEQTDRVDESGLVVNVTAGGSIIVGQRTLSLSELRARVHSEAATLAESDTTFKLMVRCDRNATSQQLNDVLNVLQGAGVSTIRLATTVPQQPSSGSR